MPELGNCCLGKVGVAAKEVTGPGCPAPGVNTAPPIPAWAAMLTTGAGAGGGVTEPAPLLKLLLEILLFTGEI